MFRNVWCGVKPAWLLAIDHLVRTGALAYQEQVAIGDGVNVALLDLLAGTTFGLAEPSALAIRTTPPQERDSLVRSALNSGRRSDAHSEVSFSWIAREIVRSRAAESEPAVVTKAMHEAGLRDVHLYPLLALETGQLALSDIQPTAVEVNGTLRLSYHDRTAVVCGDPDFALTCGLSSADGLAQLGLALIHSPLASMLERYLDTVGRIHGAGILHRPSLGDTLKSAMIGGLSSGGRHREFSPSIVRWVFPSDSHVENRSRRRRTSSCWPTNSLVSHARSGDVAATAIRRPIPWMDV